LILSVPDEDYSRNAVCAQDYIYALLNITSIFKKKTHTNVNIDLITLIFCYY